MQPSSSQPVWHLREPQVFGEEPRMFRGQPLDIHVSVEAPFGDRQQVDRCCCRYAGQGPDAVCRIIKETPDLEAVFILRGRKLDSRGEQMSAIDTHVYMQQCPETL